MDVFRHFLTQAIIQHSFTWNQRYNVVVSGFGTACQREPGACTGSHVRIPVVWIKNQILLEKRKRKILGLFFKRYFFSRFG